MRSIILAMTVGLLFTQTAYGAKITTRDGTVVTGNVEGMRDGIYTIRTPYGVIKIPATSVTTIGPDGSGEAPPPPPPSTQGATLRFSGSTTIGDELMPALIERYAAANDLKAMHWTVEGGDASEQSFKAGEGDRAFAAHLSRHGSATAFTALADGKADVGMASRPINKAELESLRTAGLGDADSPQQENVLALDGLVILVNRANPLDHLSLAQLGDIFSGQITDWQKVGGSPGPIHVLGRDAKSGTADTFKGIVMKGQKVTGGAQLMDSSDGLSDKVASDPAAIGFAGFAYTRRAKALSILTDCGIEVAPVDFFVRTEEYPLSRRLFLYTKADPDPAVHRFIGFALGHEGQEEAGQKGFVDLLPRLSTPDYSATRIAAALSLVAKAEGDTSSDLRALQTFNRIASGGRRLSVTFRFRSASFELDTRAVRDIDRLAAALKSPDMARRGLAIIGFSDSQGAPARNVRLAQARAQRIAALLREKGVAAKTVVGIGRSAPVACNTSPDGMEKNRRVEVWVGDPRS